MSTRGGFTLAPNQQKFASNETYLFRTLRDHIRSKQTIRNATWLQIYRDLITEVNGTACLAVRKCSDPGERVNAFLKIEYGNIGTCWTREG